MEFFSVHRFYEQCMPSSSKENLTVEDTKMYSIVCSDILGSVYIQPNLYLIDFHLIFDEQRCLNNQIKLMFYCWGVHFLYRQVNAHCFSIAGIRKPKNNISLMELVLPCKSTKIAHFLKTMCSHSFDQIQGCSKTWIGRKLWITIHVSHSSAVLPPLPPPPN